MFEAFVKLQLNSSSSVVTSSPSSVLNSSPPSFPYADAPVSSSGESARAHGLEEARTQLGISEQDPAEPELSMPEPAPLGAEKKRAEKVGAKGGASGPPVPKSLPVQSKVEPPSLDPAEEPLLWEGLTLNKCILVASVVALLSVTFQVLQAPCSREGVSHGRQELPPPPLHEVVRAKEEEVHEVVTAPPAPPAPPARPQPQSSVFKDDDGDDDEDDDGDADSNLAEPWIFKKWFGRSAPEVRDKEPADVPEVPPAVVEVKKSREKKPEKKEEKAREGKEERSSRREARAKDRAAGDKPSRAPRGPREPEQQPQKKRGREGKESRRERDEPRKEGWKGRPGRADGDGESLKRDWRQQKSRKPWEAAAAAGRDGAGRPREGKRRD